MKEKLHHKKIISLFILFTVMCFNLNAAGRGGQELILSDSWIYDALLSIEMEMGRVTFSDQSPLSINEVKSYLKDIDYESLSNAGKRQYNRITEYLEDSAFGIRYGLFYMGTEPSVNPEVYFKSNPDIQWIYDYTKRKALFDLPVKFGIGDYLSVYMGLQGTQSYLARFSSDNYVNHIFSGEAFDPVLTHENYLSAGYMWNNGVGVNLSYGSGTQNIGNSLMPSIILSNYLTDAPYFNFRVFSPVFNYNLNITQLTRAAYFYTHRIEARLFKKFEISFMEGVLPYCAFDLRFVNPFAIFHGYGLFNEYESVNSFFGIKFAYTPFRYLRFYGLYAQNEHTLATESSPSPEGMGFQLGTETYIPVKEGYFHGGLEFYYATPYLFIKDNPNMSFAKVFDEMIDGSKNYYQWLGNPLGPDSIAFQAAFGYEVPEVFSVDIAYNFAAKGEFSGDKIFRDSKWNKKDLSTEKWEYYNDPDAMNYRTPHGIPEYENSISLRGSWSPAPWLTLVFQPGYTFVFNSNHETGNFNQGFEIALSTRINFSKLSKKDMYFDILAYEEKSRQDNQE